MRFLALLALLAVAQPASAQEAPEAQEAPVVAHPSMTPEYQPPPSSAPATRAPTPIMVERWHRARVLYGVGSVTSLVGSVLTLSSVVVAAVTGYPCDPNDPIHMINPNDPCNKAGAMYTPPKPTDTAPLLAYLGSSVSAIGFILSASGLGLQHHLLYELGNDPSRGVFAGGTTLGVLGFAAVGAGYFFGFTGYLSPHDQGLAILGSSITGTVLCLVGGLLYTVDAGRLKRAWDRLGTF